MNTGAHIHITGRVQGVGYRYFAVRKANQLGLTGCVRNLADGSVLVIAEGEKDLIRHFVSVLRQGPGMSRVDALDVTYVEYSSKYQQFSVEY